MIVNILMPLSRSSDWSELDMVAEIHECIEEDWDNSPYVEFDVLAATVRRTDDSLLDCEKEDLEYILNPIEWDIMIALLVEEYINGDEYQWQDEDDV